MSFTRVCLGIYLALASSPLWAHPGHLEETETSAGSSAALPAPQVSITIEGGYRLIRANGVPNHEIGQFPGPGCPNAPSAQNYSFRVPLHPKTNASFTPLKQQAIGVAVNGVPFDPGTAEYWRNDRNSGWHIEALGGKKSLGLDQNNAHVQPNGAYHYHGIPAGLMSALGQGDSPKLIGYAADGFPIYAQTSGNRSSYRLKNGTRPGGSAGPGGTYDGTYEADYEFVAGSGDLDEANGRNGKTAEYPEGTYYYVATKEFPFYPRKLKGSPDPSFQRGPPGGGPGGGGTHRPEASSAPKSRVEIREERGWRIIHANGIPNHATGDFPNRHNPNAISEKDYTFRVPLTPQVADRPTPTGYAWFGVALNGVPFEPGTQEFYHNDRSSPWIYEAIGGESNLGIDQSLAHVQPNGSYHYHGVPIGLIEKLGGDEKRMLLVGWAADGFPIYSTHGHSEATNPASPLRAMKSSYQLKAGERPRSEQDPGGPYDGNFSRDFEFVPGSGDLDDCNGRFGVTPEFPQGIYHYYCTEDFPRVSRFWRGTSDPSFQKQGPPPGGGRFEGGTQGSRGNEQAKRQARGGPIQRWDQNRDGKISVEEAPPMMKANFSQHDSNGDGFIDEEEAKSLPPPGGRGAGPNGGLPTP